MLLANLPDDHVTTVSILSESVSVDEVFFNEVISFTDHNIANEKILNAVIMMVNRDTQFKGFAQLAKLLVKRDCKFSREMLEFDIGKVYVSSYTQLTYVMCMCMYVCMYTYAHTYISCTRAKVHYMLCMFI